jgi:hypothetical protein
VSMRVHYDGEVATKVLLALRVWKFGDDVRKELVCEVLDMIFEVFVDFLVTWSFFLDK